MMGLWACKCPLERFLSNLNACGWDPRMKHPSSPSDAGDAEGSREDPPPAFTGGTRGLPTLADLRDGQRGYNPAVCRRASRGPDSGPPREHPLCLAPQQQPHQHLIDHGLPNPSWSREMMGQFEKFTKKSEDRSWQRIPSYNNTLDSIPGQCLHPPSTVPPRSLCSFQAVKKNRNANSIPIRGSVLPERSLLEKSWHLNPIDMAFPTFTLLFSFWLPSLSFFLAVYRKAEYNVEKLEGTLLFVRNVATEGRGFEFAMFFNGAEKRMVVLLQPGLYLEGMIGFMHGGAMAAILDHTFASCAICALGVGMTANLSINYKSPIPLGSVVLVETKVEKMEEKKTFMSGGMRSADGRHVHAEATALFIKLDMKNPK
ncbi:uncharacterized protein LOC103053373 [Python bivittatus]|uniref:Acyl-coenzyme A thioesterase THEM4 n=1 Tax=Python bivittatus TaxID=176946 RepID=A0A9F5J121_PYTBI|nr:uncharacterized protein LOC103053373 [Python bivittatus]